MRKRRKTWKMIEKRKDGWTKGALAQKKREQKRQARQARKTNLETRRNMKFRRRRTTSVSERKCPDVFQQHRAPEQGEGGGSACTLIIAPIISSYIVHAWISWNFLSKESVRWNLRCTFLFCRTARLSKRSRRDGITSSH